ncbi:MAG: 3-oxoacyl-ACP synthase III family protein [Anaerolineae bacterium]
MNVRIVGAAASIPAHVMTSKDVVQRVKQESSVRLPLPNNTLEMMTGIKQRYYIADGQQASDLAVDAACKVLAQTNTPLQDIDLIIWASASQDVSEPATAHIVQKKLGINVAVMDVKNACNSFINGVQVAEALLKSGQYRKALVVNGETPSRFIRWDMHSRAALLEHMAGFTFGDAGAAMLLEATDEHTGIFYRKFQSLSQYWDVGGVFAGGSMYTRDLDYSYFRGNAGKLNEIFDIVGPDLLVEACEATGLGIDDFEKVVLHQVTMHYLNIFLNKAQIPREKIVLTLPHYGNMAAASMPVGFSQALERGEIQRGDKVLFLGIAGGLSLGVIMVEY